MFSVCDYLTILPHVPNKKERTHTCALYYLTLFGRVTYTVSAGFEPMIYHDSQHETLTTEPLFHRLIK